MLLKGNVGSLRVKCFSIPDPGWPSGYGIGLQKPSTYVRDILKTVKCCETRHATMKRLELEENDVPSIFPGCPSCMSSSSAITESPSKNGNDWNKHKLNFLWIKV
ncbi:hypothetical protein AVEN_92304-1 [Araneus ventricosus]|uniref:Uncharacterized protein n=1 Tax=Araneus ventricosus TaxID=182803 RepID=A0A4Y2AL90_ARAVE|nr:hypothetical protein AVEN_92304-1 [Araneus ventricosus]